MPRKNRVAASPRREASRWVHVASLLSAALPFALYLRTMAPTVYGVDSAELTTGAYLLGIVHPPGSPTYLLLGHLFSRLPFGDVGYRLNLMSACAVAISLLLFFRILLRLRCAVSVALGTSLFVGACYYVWASAVAAEIYSLQGCFAVLLILLALRARENPAGGDLLLLGFALGLGLGVHQSLALLVPGLLLLVLGAPSRPNLKRCAAAVALFLFGASVYLYLPLRFRADLPVNPARDSWQVDLTTWDGLRWMITSRGFSRLFFAVPATQWAREAAMYGYWVWSNFLGMGALAGVAGLAIGLRRTPSIHVPLLVMLVAYLAFFLPYGAGDKEVMFLPTYLLWGLWIGVAAQAFSERSNELQGARFVAVSSLFGMALLAVVVNFRFLDVSEDWTARQRGVRLITSLAPNAVFFGSFPDLRIVEYLQFVEGQRGDIQTVDLVFADAKERHRRILERLSSDAPVYVRSCRDWQHPPWRCEEIPDLGIARLSR